MTLHNTKEREKQERKTEKGTDVTSEPAGISPCFDMIGLWTVYEEDPCSGDLHHFRMYKNEGENVGLLSSPVLCVLLFPTCALGYHIHVGLVLLPLSPATPLCFDDLLMPPSSSRHHLKVDVKSEKSNI